MKLSAPIFILKQHAKALSRRDKIPLHRALDVIASREGFKSWSLLSANASSRESSAALMAQLQPGDLALIGARPGQGKTLLSLDLALKTLRRGRPAAFFTLYASRADVARYLQSMGEGSTRLARDLVVDDSDEVCADYVINRLARAPTRTLVVIDYLQLLDQKRENPDLMSQMQELKDFARRRRIIVVCLSQISRSYDPGKRVCPGLGDVRLPNPLDLGLFDRTCFLDRGAMRVSSGSAGRPA